MPFIKWNSDFGWPEIALCITSLMAYRLTRSLLRLEQQRHSDDEYRFWYSMRLALLQDIVDITSSIECKIRIPHNAFMQFTKSSLVIKLSYGFNSPEHIALSEFLTMANDYNNSMWIIDSVWLIEYNNGKHTLDELEKSGCQYYELARGKKIDSTLDRPPKPSITLEELNQATETVQKCVKWAVDNKRRLFAILSTPLQKGGS